MLKLTIAPADTAPPALPDVADSEVTTWRDPAGTICAYGHTVSGQHWMHLPGLASFRFSSSSSEVIAVAQPTVRPDILQDTYRRIVLPMALQVQGQQVLHASAVQMPQGVVAFCAFSETGKSTIAYGLGQRGYTLWADDAVAFEPCTQHIRAVPLPFRIRLRPASAAYFGPDQAGTQTSRGWVSIDPIEMEPGPLAAVFVLKRVAPADAGKAVEITRLSPSQAFPAVLTHAYWFSLQDIDCKRRMMQQYLDLVTHVAVFEVCFEDGLEKLPAILDGIEQAVDRAMVELHG